MASLGGYGAARLAHHSSIPFVWNRQALTLAALLLLSTLIDMQLLGEANGAGYKRMSSVLAQPRCAKYFIGNHTTGAGLSRLGVGMPSQLDFFSLDSWLCLPCRLGRCLVAIKVYVYRIGSRNTFTPRARYAHLSWTISCPKCSPTLPTVQGRWIENQNSLAYPYRLPFLLRRWTLLLVHLR